MSQNKTLREEWERSDIGKYLAEISDGWKGESVADFFISRMAGFIESKKEIPICHDEHCAYCPRGQEYKCQSREPVEDKNELLDDLLDYLK